jgi:thiol-disulfide isomerase/thioredoxin
MRFHRIVFVVLLGLLAVLAVVLVQTTMHPAIQITGMQPVKASDYGDLIKAVGPLPENPPTLVHFFSSWCSTCIVDHAVIEGLAGDFYMVGIVTMDKKPVVEAWLKKHGNPYQHILWDESGTLAVSSGLRGLPETFLMHQGRIWHHRGTLTSLQAPKAKP